MCGIAGFFSFRDEGRTNEGRVTSMLERLRHRGPDGQGVDVLGAATLGATRLAMLDALQGLQPMRSEDGRLLVVYNGELFGHADLRQRLHARWRGHSDTETLVAAWAAWGPAAVSRLDGMFSMAVWDDRERIGWLVRDPLGVKPLVYRETPHGIYFASEAAALVAEGESPAPDVEAIVETLVAPCFSGVTRSPFDGIEVVPPGCMLRIEPDGVTTARYWRWRTVPDDDRSPAQLAAAVRMCFESAVRGAMDSDVPLGLFASGGLDSTAIAAASSRRSPGLPAWTITFDGEDSWDATTSRLVASSDTPFARQAAETLDLVAHEVRFDSDGIDDELRRIAATNDALVAWEQELSQHTLARAASKMVKGVLVGDAADETHYGYHFLLDQVATSTPRAIFERLGSVPVLPEVDSDPRTRLDEQYREAVGEAGEDWDDPAHRIAATTRLIVERWLPRLLHNGDIHTMRHGVEARVPFASRALVELASRVPWQLALANGKEKTVLREAMRGLVPESIRMRRKSVLPTDQDAGCAYQRIARGIWTEPHPIVSRLVDTKAMEPLLGGPLHESERAQLFRVICLHHWAVHHGVRSP